MKFASLLIATLLSLTSGVEVRDSNYETCEFSLKLTNRVNPTLKMTTISEGTKHGLLIVQLGTEYHSLDEQDIPEEQDLPEELERLLELDRPVKQDKQDSLFSKFCSIFNCRRRRDPLPAPINELFKIKLIGPFRKKVVGFPIIVQVSIGPNCRLPDEWTENTIIVSDKVLNLKLVPQGLSSKQIEEIGLATDFTSLVSELQKVLTSCVVEMVECPDVKLFKKFSVEGYSDLIDNLPEYPSMAKIPNTSPVSRKEGDKVFQLAYLLAVNSKKQKQQNPSATTDNTKVESEEDGKNAEDTIERVNSTAEETIYRME